jgi:DNA invertase Pin-like site-specific DNA recombinase
MRVAIYTRISTDEEHQPYSLEAQDLLLAAYVQPGNFDAFENGTLGGSTFAGRVEAIEEELAGLRACVRGESG